MRGTTLPEDRRRRPLLRSSDMQSARKVSHPLADARTQGRKDARTQGRSRRVMVGTCTGPVATRIQVQMQSCQHGLKSVIRHDISPCLQCTLRNRKCCVLKVRLSWAEPVHWVRGLISNSQYGVRALRSAMQASTTTEEVFPTNLKSGSESFRRVVYLAFMQTQSIGLRFNCVTRARFLIL